MDRRLNASSRRLALAALAAAVLALHLWLLDRLDLAFGFGATAEPALVRMDVAFVRELAPAAAPAPAPARPARAAAKRRAKAPRPAASAPAQAASATVAAASAAAAAARAPAASASDVSDATSTVAASASSPADGASAPLAEASASAPEATLAQATRPTEAASAASPASAASAPAGAASAPPAFEWPPSTRLSYGLTGWYRGEMHGSARVQWIHVDDRYQVHLDVVVGPRFAPLMSRRMTSEGLVGDTGLRPRRYEEVTRMGFASPRPYAMRLEDDRVWLANGELRLAAAGVQDTASQFVQLTWLFTTRPELLRVGGQVELPLALPRRVDRWVYDVVAQEVLDTPLGPLPTFHLKPRRRAGGGVLTAEIWFAPTLQYLPVRIRIHQDSETFVDLLVETRPLQAER